MPQGSKVGGESAKAYREAQAALITKLRTLPNLTWVAVTYGPDIEEVPYITDSDRGAAPPWRGA